MEEQRRKINRIVLLIFLAAVVVGIIYYFVGETGETMEAQGLLIAHVLKRGVPHVSFIR